MGIHPQERHLGVGEAIHSRGRTIRRFGQSVLDTQAAWRSQEGGQEVPGMLRVRRSTDQAMHLRAHFYSKEGRSTPGISPGSPSIENPLAAFLRYCSQRISLERG